MRLEMRERIEGGLEITQQTILDARELLAYKDGPIILIMLAMETVRRETRYRPRTLFVTKAELECSPIRTPIDRSSSTPGRSTPTRRTPKCSREFSISNASSSKN